MSDQPTVAPASGISAEADTIVEGEAGAPPAGDGESLTPGTRLGRYVVLEEIGSGGMGMVFSAYDPELNRKVALKLLRPRHREKKRSRSRLLQEAQALAKLAHPNVITVYDVGTYGERVFVAMELVEGDTLKGWTTQKRRKWDEVLKVFIPAGRGLAAAHAANLVHRDFKPDNVLIGRDGRVRVMDFGLARPMRGDTQSGTSFDPQEEIEEAEEEGEDIGREGHDVAEPMLTQTGSIMGTPAYMAPEQHMGKPTDARSDQFSFCIALYHALYSELPFQGENAGDLMKAKVKGVLAEPSTGVSVPGWVRRHVTKGLSTAPNERFGSMDALLDELSDDPRVKYRKAATVAGTVLLVAAGVGGMLYLKKRPQVCFDSAEQFAKVWNEERKTTAGAGVTAVEGAHIEKTWAATAAAIDAYGESWVQMHTEACEATNLRGEQSGRLLELRNNCLTERLDEIDSLAELLSEATPAIANRSAHAAMGISPLSACADSEALAAAVDPPEGEETKAQVADIRKQLARVKTLGAVGLFDQALELARTAYATAQGLDYQPVVAEARYRLGQAEGLRGDYEQAEKNLSESAWLGASVKHDSIAAAAASELVRVVGRGGGDHEEGLSWARHAEAAIKRIGVGGFPEARLRHDIGVIHDQAGDPTLGQESLTEALKLYEAVPAASLAIIDARRSLGDVRLHQKRIDEATKLYSESKSATEELLGETHPEVALSIAGLARVADAKNDHPKALGLYKDSIELVEAALGGHDLALVPVVEELAASHQAHEEHDKAIENKQRAHQLLVDQLGEHPRVASALYDLGAAFEKAGKPKQARGQYERALKMWEKTRDKNHPDVAFALTSLGLLDVQSGEAKLAVDRLERALKLRGGRGLDPQLLAHTQFALAMALHANGGDQPRARELATKARDTFAKGKSPDPVRAEEIDEWLQLTSKKDAAEKARDKSG